MHSITKQCILWQFSSIVVCCMAPKLMVKWTAGGYQGNPIRYVCRSEYHPDFRLYRGEKIGTGRFLARTSHTTSILPTPLYRRILLSLGCTVGQYWPQRGGLGCHDAVPRVVQAKNYFSTYSYTQRHTENSRHRPPPRILQLAFWDWHFWILKPGFVSSI